MEFERVTVSPKCLSIIRTESRSARGVETGGPLVGYVEAGRVLVVVGAAGPGPRAKLEPFSVTIDGEHAQKFCDRVCRESAGHVDYVGDWHKHTGFSLQPSEHDVFAMQTMADFQFSPTKHPISLIYRTWLPALQVYVWDGSGSLKRISSRITTQNGKVS